MNIEEFKQNDKSEGYVVRLKSGIYFWLQSWDDEREVCSLIEISYYADSMPDYEKDKARGFNHSYVTVGIGTIDYITSAGCKHKGPLDNIVIWKTSLSFGDIVNCAPEDVKGIIMDMPFIELLSFIYSNSDSMKKGCNEGVMFSWDVVARTLWENIEFPEKVK